MHPYPHPRRSRLRRRRYYRHPNVRVIGRSVDHRSIETDKINLKTNFKATVKRHSLKTGFDQKVFSQLPSSSFNR